MMLAFWNARFLLKDWVTKQTEKYDVAKALRIAIAQNGFKVSFYTSLVLKNR